MPEESDWRLQGQERYLYGATVVRRAYRQYAENATWDHDHCEFCGVTFMPEPRAGSLHHGYSTIDGYRWKCPACFGDFSERFAWQVASSDEEDF